ncbi:OPT oligopeptide transporter protein-domain-containing protein [Jimgerdemannia flammicorona]|uniref:OPT oligopeptide transporter protein-domain-containing protein n=1 Tax=Jimgerdemannia flammicorona TaxID=994334 RepID=A0A433QIX8_9FUNG|nr:OPT oligopeptide transporter protein-domain-containing protein [Jimgerdemannia flammicorona]
MVSKANYKVLEAKRTEVEIDETISELTMFEEFQFTWRSTVIGSLLGCFVAASNMYLGLKLGWSFGASLFGAIFSFAIIKPLSRVLPIWAGGGYFGPKENCSAQTAATTAGGLSAGFVSAIPAMYKLGLLSADPMDDLAALIMWTLSAAFYGLFFAIPLRKHFIVKQDLVFPTPRAAAETIKSLHSTVEGEKEAMKKAYWMFVAFGTAFVWTLLSFFVPVFDTIHFLYFIGTAVGNANIVAADQVWRWWFTFDFPFIGAGLMTPGATVFSMFAGQLIGSGIAGPLMMANGAIIGGYGYTDNGPTGQSWFLWPGITLMVFSSFTRLFIRYDVLWLAIKGGCIELVNIFRPLLNKDAWADAVDDDDPVPKHEQVPLLWWGTGLLASVIFTCYVMGFMFGMPLYQTLVSIVLSFMLSFIGLQASGQTDINPLGSIGKVTQLVFAKMPAESVKAVQRNNLMAGNMASSAAAQSVDMVGDLKTGHLLGASPRSQFLAQVVGSIFAVVM